MTMNFLSMTRLLEGLEQLAQKELPFKLSLIIAKNMALLNKEQDFYIEQEREFAFKFFEVDEEGQFVLVDPERPNVFKIKNGMEKECQEARVALDDFTTEVDLRKIPASILEGLNFLPTTIMALESIIDEEA